MARVRVVIVGLMVALALSTPQSRAETEDTISKPATQNNGDSQNVQPEDESAQNNRPKRQWQYVYSSWESNGIRSPAAPSYSIWQPQYFQIKRPYFIPIWGSAGRVPIYLPPQPLYINPGYPSVNPPKTFPGVTYLPPTSTDTPGTGENTTKETDNKFGDAGPVWDQIPAKPSTPTRKPPARSTPAPPLVHKDSKEISNVPNTAEKLSPTAIGTFKPNQSGGPTRPQSTATPQRPVLTDQPSRCVWAIISCCSANSEHVSYSCFEQLGCTGAFWDNSPCESEFARSAIQAAMNYYNAAK